MNYYELFDLPVFYALDKKQLTDVYLEKQALVHPDAQLTSGAYAFPNEKLSIDLNVAYGTLMDPVKRAEYFLALRDMQVDDISVHYAVEMFAISEEYSALETLPEKLDFQQQLMHQLQEMEKSLMDVENDLTEFRKRVVLLRFISSFLEKVRLDAYNRN
jgi:Fe-S protein assembly co-chaperone HscB